MAEAVSFLQNETVQESRQKNEQADKTLPDSDSELWLLSWQKKAALPGCLYRTWEISQGCKLPQFYPEALSH